MLSITNLKIHKINGIDPADINPAYLAVAQAIAEKVILKAVDANAAA